MSNFHPAKLKIVFVPPVTPYKSVENRKYSISFINDSEEMLLTIGTKFINKNDDFRAEWVSRMGEFILKGTVQVTKEMLQENEGKKHFIDQQRKFKKFLTAIINGDKHFFLHYPWLLDAPIYIELQTKIPQSNQILYFGTPRQFLQFDFEESIYQ